MCSTVLGMGNMSMSENKRNDMKSNDTLREEEFQDSMDMGMANVEFSQDDIDSASNMSSDNDKEEPLRPKSSIRQFRDKVGAIVNNDIVQKVIVFLIAVNSLLMGIGTFDFVTENPQLDYAFNFTDKVFLIIFTIELVMQIIYHGFGLFQDGWLVFDFVIVTLSWVFNSMQGIRAFRIFRALRLVTRFKTMRNLVTALLSVVPRMLAIAALLMLIFYIFAVMFTDLFISVTEEDYPGEECALFFTSLDGTLFTLFQIMTLEWAFIARSCMNVYTWAWLPFVCFVMITSFIVFNLIIAVICDAVAVLHESGEDGDGDKELKADLQKRVRELSLHAKLLMENQERIQDALEALAKSVQYVPHCQDNSNNSEAGSSSLTQSGF